MYNTHINLTNWSGLRKVIIEGRLIWMANLATFATFHYIVG